VRKSQVLDDEITLGLERTFARTVDKKRLHRFSI